MRSSLIFRCFNGSAHQFFRVVHKVSIHGVHNFLYHVVNTNHAHLLRLDGDRYI